MLASTAFTPLALAGEFAPVIALSSLDGTIGFRLDGIKINDRSGYSVASAGDANGDGFDDLIIGSASLALATPIAEGVHASDDAHAV